MAGSDVASSEKQPFLLSPAICGSFPSSIRRRVRRGSRPSKPRTTTFLWEPGLRRPRLRTALYVRRSGRRSREATARRVATRSASDTPARANPAPGPMYAMYVVAAEPGKSPISFTPTDYHSTGAMQNALFGKQFLGKRVHDGGVAAGEPAEGRTMRCLGGTVAWARTGAWLSSRLSAASVWSVDSTRSQDVVRRIWPGMSRSGGRG